MERRRAAAVTGLGRTPGFWHVDPGYVATCHAV